jgi:RNA 2',3'-cyclic 3'-phosphodiesterase
MSDTKRLFIAIQINDHFKNLIRKFIDQQNIPEVRWIASENWHVTVLFLGDFPNGHLTALIASLKEFFQSEQFFSLDFENFTFIPKQTKPTMIWLKFYQNSYFDLLCSRLADHIEKLYTVLSLPFTINLHSVNVPHITLSRLKKAGLYYPDLNLKNIDDMQPLLRCDFCTLYQSVLTTKGAKYTNLADFKLIQN